METDLKEELSKLLKIKLRSFDTSAKYLEAVGETLKEAQDTVISEDSDRAQQRAAFKKFQVSQMRGSLFARQNMESEAGVKLLYSILQNNYDFSELTGNEVKSAASIVEGSHSPVILTPEGSEVIDSDVLEALENMAEPTDEMLMTFIAYAKGS